MSQRIHGALAPGGWKRGTDAHVWALFTPLVELGSLLNKKTEQSIETPTLSISNEQHHVKLQ